MHLCSIAESHVAKPFLEDAEGFSAGGKQTLVVGVIWCTHLDRRRCQLEVWVAVAEKWKGREKLKMAVLMFGDGRIIRVTATSCSLL